MRLIDADALSKEMYHEAFETDTEMQRWDSGCWIRYKMFENKIADVPTVCDIEQIRAEIEEMKDGFIDNTKLLNVVLEIIDKHTKGEQG